jgi:5-methyltetrahydrofolate--homocysteine methyltransferase
MLMADRSGLYEAIINGDENLVLQFVKEAINEKADPAELINTWMIPAMDEVGRRFEEQEFFVPELLLAGRAMKKGLELLRPLLVAGDAQPAGRIVLGTVKGDLHDIGKNMVGSLLEGAGFEIFDLGIDVSPEKFVEAVKTHNAQIVALSALLTMTMPAMKKVVEALSESGLRNRIKIIIGGAPITQEFANQIGADGYGENANSAVTLARSLMKS